MKSRRIAIVHDWLSVNGGAEMVLRHLLALFPSADLFTMIDTLPKEERAWLEGHHIVTSPLQRFAWARKRYRYCIPIMPYLVEQFDLSSYDLIISSSHAIAKGVIVHPHQTHIAYIYSPMRYAWDLMYEHDRLGVFGKGIVRFFMHRWLHKMRLWDFVSAQRPDVLIADSHFIAKRIEKSWRREAAVIYPPVELEDVIFSAHKEDYYVTLSRLVPYKRVDLIVEAFHQMPGKKLVVIGEGPELNTLKRYASSTIEFKGYLPKKEAFEIIAKAKGFIFMAKEDFGIAPIEAQACGTPVIAYGQGGAAETVIEDETGLFVTDQSAEALIEAVKLFETKRFDPYACVSHAHRFSPERFREDFLAQLAF